MKKSFKALFAGLCALAAIATGCNEEPKIVPEVASAEATVVSAEAMTATIKLTTKLLTEYAYVVRTDATSADDAAIIFLEGNSGELVDGDTEIVLKGLHGNTDYIVKFAFRESESQFYAEILTVEFTTGDYTDNLTILETTDEGFTIHFKVPQEVKDRNNAIRYNFGSLPVYLMSKVGWYSVPDASILLQNGQHHFVNDTTITYGDFNVYELDENGDYIYDEWTGEPILVHDPFTPGEPLILLAGEFSYDTDNMTGWGNGWYNPMFDSDSYYEYLYGGGGGWGPLAIEIDDNGSDEDQFWTGWYARKHITLPQPEELDCTLGITMELGAKKGTITFSPDENVWQYCVFIVAEADYEMILQYLDNNEDYLQWFTASYPAAAYFGTFTFEGPVQLTLEDYYYLEPETEYRLFVTALGDENGLSQKFYNVPFSTVGKSLPAPEVEVKAISNPSGQESPYEVWFNVKCTNKLAQSGRYACNYNSEWGKLLNRGYTYNDIIATGNRLSDADIEQINSDEGMNMKFSTLPDMETLLGVVLYNEEETCNIVDIDNALASATSIKEPAKTPVTSSLFSDLVGTWTMSASTAKYEGGSYVDAGVQKCKVTISDGFTLPETLADSVYTIYSEVTGKDKDAVDAEYEGLKKEVAAFNANLKAQNRLLCTGFGFDKADSYVQYYKLNTPYDYFVSRTYNGYDNRSIIWDCGPKWYLEVLEDGSLVVPINDAHQYPLCFATYYTMYLAGVGEGGYITRLYDDEDCTFPCEVADDKNSFVVKPYIYNDVPYYLTGVYTYYGYVYPTTLKIVSELTLTRGWDETEPASSAATRSSNAVTTTIASDPVNGNKLNGTVPTMRRTPMVEHEPIVYQQATYRFVKVEDAVKKMMKAYGYER
ncbi:MAG: hypothetical protein ACI399_00695 [Candidatus Cryptobacteroides sp.]